MAKKANGAARAVVVTTAHRGVFFGYATETHGEQIGEVRGDDEKHWALEREVIGECQ